MPAMRDTRADLLRAADAVARGQAGVVSRQQLVTRGWTDSMIKSQLHAGRWQACFRGVYAVSTGGLSPQARVWAALLSCGAGAVAAGLTAAWLHGLVDQLPDVLEIAVPPHRDVVGGPGIVVRRDRHLYRRRHPAQSPPRLRIEEVVLDLADGAARVDDLVGWITRACQRRLTTADRLEQARLQRPRLRQRTLIGEVLDASRDGVASSLEHRWRRDVEKAHGLPTGSRNHRELIDRGQTPSGGRGAVYRDVRYQRFAVVVELDGRLAHPFEDRGRDAHRDRLLAAQGETTLRFGWADAAGRPCESAAELAAVLHAHGWRGELVPCGPTCTAAPRSSVVA